MALVLSSFNRCSHLEPLVPQREWSCSLCLRISPPTLLITSRYSVVNFGDNVSRDGYFDGDT